MEDVGLVTAESKSCCFELDLLLFALLHLRSIDDGFLGSCKVSGDIPNCGRGGFCIVHVSRPEGGKRGSSRTRSLAKYFGTFERYLGRGPVRQGACGKYC